MLTRRLLTAVYRLKPLALRIRYSRKAKARNVQAAAVAMEFAADLRELLQVRVPPPGLAEAAALVTMGTPPEDSHKLLSLFAWAHWKSEGGAW